jgi:hypothetical protein
MKYLLALLLFCGCAAGFERDSELRSAEDFYANVENLECTGVVQNGHFYDVFWCPTTRQYAGMVHSSRCCCREWD